MSLYEHVPHPHVAARQQQGPVKAADQRQASGGVARFNTRLALATTHAVGSMWCAYAFAAFDCLALPQALAGGLFGIVQWVASFFLQLVLLSIIMVGQNVQADAADKRSEATYKDAEAVLYGQEQQAEHLAAQDRAITSIQAHLEQQDGAVAGILTQVQLILDHVRPPGGAP